jgi:hypothetical protein
MEKTLPAEPSKTEGEAGENSCNTEDNIDVLPVNTDKFTLSSNLRGNCTQRSSVFPLWNLD